MSAALVALACFRGALAHVPPTPSEYAHLAKLQQARREANERQPKRRLDTAPDYTCSEGVQSEAENWKVSGTSLVGWLVLEPWLTPSLFYQFLGTDIKYGPDIDNIRLKTGMDQKSFCRALGPAEANRQLRRHWKLWVTEKHIADIAATGATHLRIPIGDWMFEPYGVYDEVEEGVRCNDGALDELDRALSLCTKYGLKVLLDMHAWIGSQNGLDNSGETKFVQWASKFDSGTSGEMYAPKGTFEHWALKGWDWIINSTADWGTAMSLTRRTVGPLDPRAQPRRAPLRQARGRVGPGAGQRGGCVDAYGRATKVLLGGLRHRAHGRAALDVRDGLVLPRQRGGARRLHARLP